MQHCSQLDLLVWGCPSSSVIDVSAFDWFTMYCSSAKRAQAPTPVPAAGVDVDKEKALAEKEAEVALTRQHCISAMVDQTFQKLCSPV